MARYALITMLVTLLVLAGAGCSTTKPSTSPAPAQKAAELGMASTLTVGQSVLYPDGLQVRLEKIDDSRCPPNAVCVWQGELAPTLWLSGGQVAIGQDLQLGTVRGAEGTVGGYVIALQEATTETATIVVTKAPNP